MHYYCCVSYDQIKIIITKIFNSCKQIELYYSNEVFPFVLNDLLKRSYVISVFFTVFDAGL